MSVILNLIVKNESRNILRCLNSFNTIKQRNSAGELVEAIYAIAIMDTGSTDDTVALAEQWIAEKGKKGGVLSKPWQEPYFHFGINRTLALEYAYQVIEENSSSGEKYIMFTDADNLIASKISGQEIVLPTLTEEKYLCEFRTGNCLFEGQLMIKYSPEKSWSWTGGVHEYLSSRDTATAGRIECLYMDARCEGCRSQDDFKYIRDVKHLKSLIEKAEEYKKREVQGQFEKDEADCLARYHFYLAQSYRDSGIGLHQQSEETYIKRTTLGSWPQEIYVSFVEAYKQRVIWKKEADLQAASYLLRAFEIDPERWEAPYYYIKYLNSEKLFAVAWNFVKPLINKPEKKEGKLFLESHINEWGFLDEAGVSAYHAQDKAMAKLLFEKVLPRIPESQKERMRNNINFCLQ